MSYNIVNNMPSKKGRPSTKINKLNDVKDLVTNQDVKNKIGEIINYVSSNQGLYPQHFIFFVTFYHT